MQIHQGQQIIFVTTEGQLEMCSNRNRRLLTRAVCEIRIILVQHLLVKSRCSDMCNESWNCFCPQMWGRDSNIGRLEGRVEHVVWAESSEEIRVFGSSGDQPDISNQGFIYKYRSAAWRHAHVTRVPSADWQQVSHQSAQHPIRKLLLTGSAIDAILIVTSGVIMAATIGVGLLT